MNSLNTANRRTFLRNGALGAGALWVSSLQELSARRAHGEYSPGRSKKKGDAGPNAYGPPSPKPDETTGLNLLQLPDGFRYYSYSWTGDAMSDGVICPSLHDGMAVVDEWPNEDDDSDDDGDDHRRRSSRLVLVRNHEAGNGSPYLDRPAITFASDGAGGTTNLLFDAKAGKWLEAWSSLAGTIRNCAGAVTPWGTWISQEETVVPGHGWSFEVGATKGCSIGGPAPLHDMGRFSHEASMVDPRTGYVYETEDSGDCGFFRFIPHSRGKLALGGKLYMMSVKDQPNADLGGNIPVGTTWDVRWVRIDDPSAASISCFGQGSAKGGARFRRLEGAWWGDGVGYFVSTDGGSVREGQLFEYDPREETLKLIYDSPVATALDNPDNIVVTPRGGILFCEDAAGGSNLAAERLVGLTAEGEAFTFGINNVNLTVAYNSRIPAGNYTGSEWAGACYSPDGRWLFVNIQTPGITFAITGPWGRGPL